MASVYHKQFQYSSRPELLQVLRALRELKQVLQPLSDVTLSLDEVRDLVGGGSLQNLASERRKKSSRQ